MPVVKRAIEPSDISRRQLTTEVKNELECVANNTLACIIQQLSSLSKHSEDLFGELYAETYSLATRTSNLCTRIEKLKNKIVQLNPTVEEVLLQEINLRKPFKISVSRDQQIMMKSTRPSCINEVYMSCEAPPNLSELDFFREDGKSSLKFYTDPNYFVELWYSEMKAVQHQQKKPRNKQGQVHKTSSKPKALRTPKNKIEEFKDFRHGPEFVENFRREHSFKEGGTSNGTTIYRAIEFVSNADHYHVDTTSESMDNIKSSRAGKHLENEGKYCATRSSSLAQISSPRPVGPPPAPPKKQSPSHFEINHVNAPNHNTSTGIVRSQLDGPDTPTQVRMLPSSNYHHYQEESFSSDNSLPPPPPSPHRVDNYPPVDFQHQLPSPPKAIQSVDDSQMNPLPPPPLPDSLLHDVFLQPIGEPRDAFCIDTEEAHPCANTLVLPQPDQESLASNSSSTTCSTSAADALKINHLTDKGPLIRDTRSDLLAAIREGIQLRKVEEHRLKTEQNKKAGGPLDVQSIMEAAFEMRRKALEENESDREEEDEANWSD